MEISKKDEELIMFNLRNHKLTLKEIIVVLDGMSKEVDGIEYAALTQAAEHLAKYQLYLPIFEKKGKT